MGTRHAGLLGMYESKTQDRAGAPPLTLLGETKDPFLMFAALKYDKCFESNPYKYQILAESPSFWGH
jgi:hypothetical protein